MTDPATPGQEGPSYGPPSLPHGWIAQWDATSKKYYFVQLSTGMTQWETPTHAAPTVGTPTQTPGQETSPFAQPGHQHEMGERGVEGSQNGGDADRGLGTMAVNTLLHSQGGGKQSNLLLGLAGIGGTGKHNQSQQTPNTGAAGLVGALAGNLLSGGKTSQNHGPQSSYSGQTPQGAYGHQDGLMGKLGGMFSGTSSGHQQNNFGYSESGQHQGGYTGQAPPSSYQPAGSQNTQTANTHYNPQQPPYLQHQQESSYSGTGSYYNQQQSYPQNPQSGPNIGSNTYYNQQPQPTYGANQRQQHQQQQGYNAPPQQQQQQPPYGGAPPQQEPYPSPIYIGPAPSNLTQPQHHMYQGQHNNSYQGGMYGDGGSRGPPPPHMGGHPSHGHYGGYPSLSGHGGYHEMSGPERW